MRPISAEKVARVFDSYPVNIRRKLMELRTLVFETAESIEAVGTIEETLRWGEPAYVTSETGSGTTVRIGWKRSHPSQYAMYFHCGTDLIETFRTLFPGELAFEGNRAIVFDERDCVPRETVSYCIGVALTYHQRKKRERREAAR